MYYYAQLNESNVCIGISSLAGEVPEINYSAQDTFDPITGTIKREMVFASRMIRVPVYSSSYMGLRYTTEGKWAVAK